MGVVGGLLPSGESVGPRSSAPSSQQAAAAAAAAAVGQRDVYQMPNGYMPNGYTMMHDPSAAAYQTQHSAYMSNYHRYDMAQMAAGNINYMGTGPAGSAAAAGAGAYGMYGTVSAGQTSPYQTSGGGGGGGGLQQPGSPYSGLQQPGSPYGAGLTQPGSQMSCQSHSPSDSSVKSEPVSPGPMHNNNNNNSLTTNNNHILKGRPTILSGDYQPEISNLMSMYGIGQDPISVAEHHQRSLMYHNNSVSPDLHQQQQHHQAAAVAAAQQQQQAALRSMAPLAHM